MRKSLFKYSLYYILKLEISGCDTGSATGTRCPIGQSFVFSVCVSPTSMRKAPWCSFCMMHQVIDNVFPIEDGTARAMEDGAAPPSAVPPDTARRGATPLGTAPPDTQGLTAEVVLAALAAQGVVTSAAQSKLRYACLLSVQCCWYCRL
jgi:hypothetical protein